MINVIESEDGVRILDVESYLDTIQKIRLKGLDLNVGLFSVEDMTKTKALGQEFQARAKAAKEAGEELDDGAGFANIVDQMMVVLKRFNPTLERAQLEQLPPSAINGVFKFILREGMGLEKELGNATVEAGKTATTSA